MFAAGSPLFVGGRSCTVRRRTARSTLPSPSMSTTTSTSAWFSRGTPAGGASARYGGSHGFGGFEVGSSPPPSRARPKQNSCHRRRSGVLVRSSGTSAPAIATAATNAAALLESSGSAAPERSATRCRRPTSSRALSWAAAMRSPEKWPRGNRGDLLQAERHPTLLLGHAPRGLQDLRGSLFALARSPFLDSHRPTRMIRGPTGARQGSHRRGCRSTRSSPGDASVRKQCERRRLRACEHRVTSGWECGADIGFATACGDGPDTICVEEASPCP